MPVALGFQSAIARTTFRRFSVSLPHSLRTPGKRPTNTRGSRRILENLCLRVVFKPQKQITTPHDSFQGIWQEAPKNLSDASDPPDEIQLKHPKQITRYIHTLSNKDSMIVKQNCCHRYIVNSLRAKLFLFPSGREPCAVSDIPTHRNIEHNQSLQKQ